MATFTYDISDYRRKDGTYQVRIRMIHNRTVIRKPTTVYVSKEQLSRDLSKIRDSYVLEVVNRQLTTAKEAEAIIQPYGIIVNPNGRDFYLMDAKNYVSSGDLLHFHQDGTFDYKVRTGDIPAHAVFLTKPKK